MSQNNKNNITEKSKVENGRRWPKVIIITGPTASGKSSLAIEVALRLGCEIISADSRQIFRGIPVTTAVPSENERRGVKHHLLEEKELDQYYSAANFREDAMKIMMDAALRGQEYIIICGGSMMYIDALLYGLDDLPPISDEVRTRVKEMEAQIGVEGIKAYLENIDPDYEKKIDSANPRRVMHALELYFQSGLKPNDILTGTKDKCEFDYLKFVLTLSRDEMFERINARVEEMVENGMENEARKVYPQRHLNSINTIGFKEWFMCFDGVLDRETTVARIAKNTRVYAKKQLTWLAKSHDNVLVSRENAIEKIFEEIEKQWPKPRKKH